MTPAVSAAEILAGVEVIDERDVPFGEISRSPLNPRQSFDEVLIAKMALTITTICQLNPLTIREDGELIDGETRHRAGEVGQAKTLRCKVVRCTDAQAACIRLMTTVQRRDLNPIERAKALVALETQHGLSRKQLAELVDLQKDSISNITRLLELPEIWQQRLISGEITAAASRQLVPWKDEPAVLAGVESQLERKDKGGWSIELDGVLQSAVRCESRPLRENYYYDSSGSQARVRNVDLKPTVEQREALRIRTVGKESRAFNLALWEQLQTSDEQAHAAKEAAKRDKSTASGKALAAGLIDPAQARAAAQKQAEQLAKRLYRFRVSWFQSQILGRLSDTDFDRETLLALLVWLATRDGQHRRREAIETACSTRGKSKGRHAVDLLAELLDRDAAALWPVIREMTIEQIGGRFDGYHNVFDPSDIETLARILDIQPKRDWSTSFDEGAACEHLWDDFVGLWSKDQLSELLDEWKIKTPEFPDRMKAKRSDLLNYLVASKPCPKSLLEAKAVRLT